MLNFLADLVVDQSKFSLVGKFLGVRSDLDMIRKWDMEKWRSQAGMEIIALPKSFFWVKLRSSEDVEKILSGGLWFYGRRGLFLKKMAA